jgi:hypothetical protein
MADAHPMAAAPIGLARSMAGLLQSTSAMGAPGRKDPHGCIVRDPGGAGRYGGDPMSEEEPTLYIPQRLPRRRMSIDSCLDLVTVVICLAALAGIFILLFCRGAA